MSRKRADAGTMMWADRMRIGREADALAAAVADDAAIDARAEELGIDRLQLRSYVAEARRRT